MIISKDKLIQEFGTLVVANLELITALTREREDKNLLQAQLDALSDVSRINREMTFPDLPRSPG